MNMDRASLIPALTNIATRLRIDSVRATSEAGSGHPTSCMSMADLMAALFFAGLRSVDLKPEQKAAVDSIEADVDKLGDQHKDSGAKLLNDIADGVAAGKVDHKKTDADVRDITKAVEASVPGIQDAVTRLYKTLDATQRKTLVAAMREHAEDMHEHGMMMGEHGMGGHEHGMVRRLYITRPCSQTELGVS